MMEDMEDKAAFPSDRYGEIGMTLRDYFASKALPIAYSHFSRDLEDRGSNYYDAKWADHKLWAECAYELADAMLKARGD
jgi:hypothetical protein